MSEIADLLEQTKDSNKKERQNAVKELGNLDTKYAPVIERLEYLRDIDPEKGVRKEAEKALKKLDNKPLEAAVATVESGSEGTAFDDEVGDSTLRPGEFDVESSLSDEEEDRREELAEGKGVRVLLKENNVVTMNYYGDVVEKGKSTGQISVANTGSNSRISGVDLELANVNNVTSERELSERNAIGLLVPGREMDWKADYSFETEILPIKVEQSYEDPDTELSSNFAGGNDVDYEAKITITNITDDSIANVRGVKTLNDAASMTGSSSSSGSVSSSDGGATFEIDEIAAGESVTVNLNLRAALAEDVPSYRAGELKITYEDVGSLASGLEFVSVDGVSDVGSRIKRKQRETEPGFYDCEIIFENKSEFVYDLNKFTVFADSFESQQIVLDWDGTQATQDEREIVPGEKVAFEFVFESFEGAPTFGDYLEFSVQSEVELVTQTTVTLPSEELRYMALAITKAFLMDGEEVSSYELPSYVETEVPTLLIVTGVGTFPLEAITIRDEIPEGFRISSTEQVTVSRGEVPMSEDQYSVNATEELTVTLEHLEETADGGFKEGDTISVKYPSLAVNPEPREDVIQSQAHTEGYIYSAPETKVRASSTLEELELIVVHRRDDLDIGKTIESLDYEGQNAYKIRLDAENYGSSVANYNIEDLIPNGFRFVDGSLESQPEAELVDPKDTSEGMVRGWKFSDIQPEQEVWASYLVVEDSSDADPRKLQSVYRG
ncbi:MAG: hypothetical protein ACXADH_12080 [Candidatus Kariarchaeaceae archaeon]|jgi:hypothetical protein